ncbi:aromatic-ring-hydroxylating dioxygenase subunit beta [Actinophytocola sp.]|uniref:aromatic-ring-hydroxylating dioxygenase subunit beta n=1 Tax=Actinophytocola sp. TaxID=1872138 RepID=UPI003D6B3220
MSYPADDAEILKFIYREARLIDEGRLKEWHALWTDDPLYLVPCNDANVDTAKQVSIIFDDGRRLEERIFRLTNADAHSQEPRSRVTHLVTGVEVYRDDPGEVRVHAALIIVEVRKGEQEIYAGRADYRLAVLDGEIKLAEKRVFLTRNDSPLGNLTFII